MKYIQQKGLVFGSAKIMKEISIGRKTLASVSVFTTLNVNLMET
jgi:hypothetical protein